MPLADLTHEDDKKAIDAIAQAFFRAFSNKDGNKPDLDTLYDLFIPQGLVLKTCGDAPTVYALRDFIEPRARLLNDGTLLDFSEQEIWSRTDIFGNIAQRFCLYRKSGVLSGEPFETKGMKSLQLVRVSGVWKLSSVAWDDEREGLSAPQPGEINEAL